MKFEGMRKPGEYKKAFVSEKYPELKGVFRGNPYRFLSHWVPRTDDPTRKRIVHCQGEHCEICMTGNKCKWYFRINCIQQDELTKEWYASVYEGNDSTYNRLGALNDEVPLEQYSVIISYTKEGSYQNDLFKINRELPIEISQMIDRVALIDLTRI